jgi:two-component system sensor histidine kinase RegB
MPPSLTLTRDVSQGIICRAQTAALIPSLRKPIKARQVTRNQNQMPAYELQLFQEQKRSNWVRLRTLVTLRWFAIIGQSIAVFVAVRLYGL